MKKFLLHILILATLPVVGFAQDANNESRVPQVIVISENDTNRVVRIGKNKVDISETEDGNEVNIYLGGKNREKKSNDFTGHLFGVDLGYNSYLTSLHSTALPESQRFMNINGSRSVGVTIHVIQESIRLNRKGNIGLVTGVGIEYNNYRFDSNYRLVKTETGNIGYEMIDGSVEKNKLTTCYLTVPLLLEVQGLSRYTGHPAYIAAGVVGGLRLSSHTKIVYGDSQKEKERGAFNLNDFRYGLMLRTGYKSISLFGVYYPVALFKKSGDPELYPFCIGVALLPKWM